MTDVKPTSDGLDELRALSSLIQDSIEKISGVLSSTGKTFPSTHGGLSMSAESVRSVPEIASASAIGCAAATQLLAVLGGPMNTLIRAAMSGPVVSSLNAVSEANVAEALREAGPQGAHAKDLAKARGVDAGKLARIMRLLALNHIFVEKAPDVFAHNTASALLDTGKSVEALRQSPGTKHNDTLGIAAIIELCTGEQLKALSYLPDVLLDPKRTSSGEVNETAFNAAFKTTISAWDYFELPENSAALARMTKGMEAGKRIAPPDAILRGYGWEKLPEGAIVVDVGGGVGTQSKKIAAKCPGLKFVVQDREPVVKAAEQFWADIPDAVPSGRVILQGTSAGTSTASFVTDSKSPAHDFFTPQPQKNARVFILGAVLHDWSDDYALKILKPLREAATPETELVVVDSLLQYLADDSNVADIPGSEREKPPAPLLPALDTMSYAGDIMMLSMFNGTERTISQFRDLLAKAGWRVTRVHHGAGLTQVLGVQKVIAVPI
ncbi:S-adenosyl-L-methionine-dependent methyltransferase [Peniophora sp. CONT]|nr:S-adenosyl-L-methionine-dependent methyltransferase [Peniophora sp. CONT]